MPDLLFAQTDLVNAAERIGTSNWTTTGILLLVLLGGAFAIYRTAYWLAPRLDRLLDKIVDHLTSVGEVLRALSEGQESMNRDIRAIREAVIERPHNNGNSNHPMTVNQKHEQE